MVQDMDPPNDNECVTKPKEMLQKARQQKHGGHNSILERYHKDDEYCDSLSKIGWTEKQFIQFDILALEDQSYVATNDERIRNRKGWVLKFNKEGAQGPLNQRPDFVDAKREIK